MADLWLSRARTDLAAARVVFRRDPDVEPWIAVFHAQQAAEKAIKAILVARNINPPYVHDLSELAGKLPPGAHAGASMEDVDRLDDLSAGVRYLGLSIGLMEQREPTWVEADESLAIATRIVEAATAQIRGR